MLLGTVQISKERLSSRDINDICRTLEFNSVQLLSLRECQTTDKDFEHFTSAISRSGSLNQLNLNLGIVCSLKRVQYLSSSLFKNRTLTSLFLHGSNLSEPSASILCKALSSHPNLVSIDLGDCRLTDKVIPHLTKLLKNNGAKRGLKDLTLSANPAITSAGWVEFCVSLAAGCCLQTLYLDYNKIGDTGTSCLAVMLAANKTLQTLDLEATGITNEGAKLLLYTAVHHSVYVKEIILTENTISKHLMLAIKSCLERKVEHFAGSLSSNSLTADDTYDSDTAEGYESSIPEVVSSSQTNSFGNISMRSATRIRFEDENSDSDNFKHKDRYNHTSDVNGINPPISSTRQNRRKSSLISKSSD